MRSDRLIREQRIEHIQKLMQSGQWRTFMWKDLAKAWLAPGRLDTKTGHDSARDYIQGISAEASKRIVAVLGDKDAVAAKILVGFHEGVDDCIAKKKWGDFNSLAMNLAKITKVEGTEGDTAPPIVAIQVNQTVTQVGQSTGFKMLMRPRKEIAPAPIVKVDPEDDGSDT